MARIDKLTPEQAQQLAAHREYWLSVGLSTEPAERPRAETALREMYALVDKTLSRIEWVDSPLAGCQRAGELLKAPKAKRVSEGLAACWHWGQHDVHWIAHYLFGVRLTGYDNRSNLRKLHLHAELAQSAAWVWAVDDVAIICERPRELHLEITPATKDLPIYRLHREDGKAIVFPDGYGLYMWHGVRVPERVIMQPDTLTAADVTKEANAEVARCILERIGIQRFAATAKAEVLDADVDGGGQIRRLLRLKNPHTEAGHMVALHVTCPSTGRQYVLPVPPTMKTGKQAAAWMVGIDNPENYRPSVEV